jgi:hypothetical protein
MWCILQCQRHGQCHGQGRAWGGCCTHCNIRPRGCAGGPILCVLVPATFALRGSNGNQVRFKNVRCRRLGVGAAYMLAAKLTGQAWMHLPKHIRRKFGSTACTDWFKGLQQRLDVISTSATSDPGSCSNLARRGLCHETSVLDTSSPNG